MTEWLNPIKIRLLLASMYLFAGSGLFTDQIFGKGEVPRTGPKAVVCEPGQSVRSTGRCY